MEINKKNKTELKSFFRKNKIPTEQQYGQFIDAGINQAEDGIVKVAGSPASIQAEGESTGTQEVLNLFSSFTNDHPDWSLNLNPGQNPEEVGSNQPGLNIKDSKGETCLFIRSSDGNIGIGTIAPSSKLTVQGAANSSVIAAIANTEQRSKIFEVARREGGGTLSLRKGDNTSVVHLSGTPQKPSFFLGKVGIRDNNPSAPLQLRAKNAMLKVTNTGTGPETAARLRLHHSKNNHKSWEITAKQGSGDLEFIPTANNNNKLIMKNDGSLEAPGGVFVEGSADHPNTNGALYRHDGQVYLTVKDHFYIRDKEGGPKVHFNTKSQRIGVGAIDPEAPLSISGSGKESSPDTAMHMTNQCILFGGNNAGKHSNSAKISAGTDIPNSLNIVGMASGTGSADRKVDIFCEGGTTVRGPLYVNDYLYNAKPVAFSAHLESQQSGNILNKIGFADVCLNLGNAFSSGIFTAPVKGVYVFITALRVLAGTISWRLILDPADGSSNVYLNSNKEGEQHEKEWLLAKVNQHTSKTVYTQLNAGDKVFVRQHVSGSSKSDNYSSSFEGALLYALP